MASEQRKPIIAFDLYGTLLSTESIADALAEVFGSENASALAALWRRYQLEYSWRLNSMGNPSPFPGFAALTQASLLHAAAELNLPEPTSHDVDKLMAAYDNLRVFPDVRAGLAQLREASVFLSSGSGAASENDDRRAFIFSNGDHARIAGSVASSPDLKPLAHVFVDFVSVSEACEFKPGPRAYEHFVGTVRRRFGAGVDVDGGDVWLVSSNAFDVLGAKAAGWRAVFVDRAGKGWTDRLGEVVGGLRPDVVVRGVDEAVKVIMDRSETGEAED